MKLLEQKCSVQDSVLVGRVAIVHDALILLLLLAFTPSERLVGWFLGSSTSISVFVLWVGFEMPPHRRPYVKVLSTLLGQFF